jgi:hypothetical protein
LQRFLDYWRRELEGALHSVRVAHNRLIKPTEWRAVDGIIHVHEASAAARPGRFHDNQPSCSPRRPVSVFLILLLIAFSSWACST